MKRRSFIGWMGAALAAPIAVIGGVRKRSGTRLVQALAKGEIDTFVGFNHVINPPVYGKGPGFSSIDFSPGAINRADIDGILNDPNGPYVQAFAQAAAKRMDDIIIAGSSMGKTELNFREFTRLL